MALSMNDPLKRSDQMTSADLPAAISSPALADGTTPSSSPTGPWTDLFGRAAVPVNPSRRAANNKVQPTLAISGRIGRGSSASVALQRSLASRLRAHLPTAGSTLFSMSWKDGRTPAGRLICRLRVSALRTSGNDCGSWPSPNTPSGGRSVAIEKMSATGKTLDGRKRTVSLKHVAKFAAWPTPIRQDAGNARNHTARRTNPHSTHHDGLTLLDAASLVLANWATHGPIAPGSPAATASIGQLNPAFSRWLMGYPPVWDDCAAMATPLSRKSRRSSSEHS